MVTESSDVKRVQELTSGRRHSLHDNESDRLYDVTRID